MIAIQTLYQYFLNSTGVSTDTRKIKEGSLYFALKGPNFNGNKFASEALSKGAQFAIVDEEEYADSHHTLYFPDALKALQELAAYHRKQLDIPVIGIGGSNGKTTTKELVAITLSAKYKTYATEGNLNNHIGVPLTLLRLTKDHQMAVVELGATEEGEIALLCEIAQPSHGIITNIGKDHIEGFGSIEGVARANSELYLYLLKNKGITFLNTNEEMLVSMASRLSDVVTYPNANDTYSCQIAINKGFFLSVKDKNGSIINTKLVGEYNFANVATALTIGNFFNVKGADMQAAIEAYRPGNMRSQWVETANNQIILDAYNANPSSMHAALDTFERFKHPKKGVIFGDMAELGHVTEEEHISLLERVAKQGFAKVILVGPEMTKASHLVKDADVFQTPEQAINYLKTANLKEYLFLLKGSRSAKIETLQQAL